MVSTAEVHTESAWLNAAPPWWAQGMRLMTEMQPATGPNPSEKRKRKAPEISDVETQLGKLANGYARRLQELGWTDFVASARGRSNINEAVAILPHRAAQLLSHLSKRGASVPTLIAPWSKRRKDDAIQRGPHQLSQGERKFVAKELLNFCEQGYWIVLPYNAAFGRGPSERPKTSADSGLYVFGSLCRDLVMGSARSHAIRTRSAARFHDDCARRSET
jgi:hypothetical protein